MMAGECPKSRPRPFWAYVGTNLWVDVMEDRLTPRGAYLRSLYAIGAMVGLRFLVGSDGWPRIYAFPWVGTSIA
jgi:hypothetical protein